MLNVNKNPTAHQKITTAHLWAVGTRLTITALDDKNAGSENIRRDKNLNRKM